MIQVEATIPEEQIPEEGQNDEEEFIEAKVGEVHTFAEQLQRRADG